jgi:hypothetical protein
MAGTVDSEQEYTRILKKIIRENNLAIPDSVVTNSYIDRKSKVVNAYTDGKKVVITQPLWRQLKTEDQRAFVIGHELGFGYIQLRRQYDVEPYFERWHTVKCPITQP